MRRFAARMSSPSPGGGRWRATLVALFLVSAALILIYDGGSVVDVDKANYNFLRVYPKEEREENVVTYEEVVKHNKRQKQIKRQEEEKVVKLNLEQLENQIQTREESLNEEHKNEQLKTLQHAEEQQNKQEDQELSQESKEQSTEQQHLEKGHPVRTKYDILETIAKMKTEVSNSGNTSVSNM